MKNETTFRRALVALAVMVEVGTCAFSLCDSLCSGNGAT